MHEDALAGTAASRRTQVPRWSVAARIAWAVGLLLRVDGRAVRLALPYYQQRNQNPPEAIGPGVHPMSTMALPRSKAKGRQLVRRDHGSVSRQRPRGRRRTVVVRYCTELVAWS